MALNKLQKTVKDFTEKHTTLSKKATDRLVNGIGIKTDINSVKAIVKREYGAAGVRRDVYDNLMAHIITGIEIGAGVEIAGTRRVNAFKRWYLENAYSAEGVKFSETVNDISRVPEIIKDIRESMAAGKSWRTAAQDLQDLGIQRPDVAQDVSGVIAKAKRVYGLTDDSEAYQAYKQEVMAVQRRINRLVDQDTSKLKRAYQNIIDITNKSSAAQVERAIKYTAYFKERYNAERIARTEIARAYGDAATSDALYDDDVIGIRFMLSSGHPAPDVCDIHTDADLFGLGPGGYPKDFIPEFPFHPHCLCSQVNIYRGEYSKPNKNDYNPEAGKKYLKSLSKPDQESILGVTGREEFIKHPDKWQKIVTQYEKPHTVKPTIPKEKLYGDDR